MKLHYFLVVASIMWNGYRKSSMLKMGCSKLFSYSYAIYWSCSIYFMEMGRRRLFNPALIFATIANDLLLAVANDESRNCL